MPLRSCLLAAVVGTAVLAAPLVGQTPGGYRLAKKIPVGGEGGWDYLTVEGTRLYVSHGTKLVVIDLTRDSIVGEVANTPGIHGAAIAPALNRGFTSNGRDSTITVFDLTTLATIDRIKINASNPDAIHYEPVTKRIFTFNGRSLDATAIDAESGKEVGTVPLGAKPEFAQDDGNGLIFVNLETDTGQVAVIDAATMKETKRYWLPGCEEPSGMAFDRANGRIFSVCGNAVMVVSDPATGKVVAKVPIGPGVDATAYDPETKLIFASNGGDGTLSVIRQDGPDHYTSLGTTATQRSARTMALDPATHRVFLSAAEFGPAPAPAQPGGRPGRPPMIPGSFTVLVVDRK